jgi:hypothetical protein
LVALLRTRRERPRGDDPAEPQDNFATPHSSFPEHHELSKILHVNFALFGTTARSQRRDCSRDVGFRDVATALAPRAANQSDAAATKKYAQAFGPKLETLTAQLFPKIILSPARTGEGIRDIIGSRFFFASRYISFLLNWSAKYSACRIANATMVRVGFSAPPLVNWLPSEMNRFGMSWVWPYLLHTPSRGFSL